MPHSTPAHKAFTPVPACTRKSPTRSSPSSNRGACPGCSRGRASAPRSACARRGNRVRNRIWAAEMDSGSADRDNTRRGAVNADHLRYGDEVRYEAEYFKGIKGKPDPKEKKLLTKLTAEHTQNWSPSLATDPV